MGLTNKLQMEAPLLTAPVVGIQHRGCEGHAVGYCDALRVNKRIGVTVASNHFSFEFIETFLSKNIHLFEWKARAAARKVESNLPARRQPL